MRRLRASFDTLRFNTPEGVRGGDALQVVKRVAFLPNGQYPDSLQARMGETFWYCVGPGNSYWLAMPMRLQRRNGPIEWVVR